MLQLKAGALAQGACFERLYASLESTQRVGTALRALVCLNHQKLSRSQRLASGRDLHPVVARTHSSLSHPLTSPLNVGGLCIIVTGSKLPRCNGDEMRVQLI